jgi:hypothetical protein
MEEVGGRKRMARKEITPKKKPIFGFTLSSFDGNGPPQRSQRIKKALFQILKTKYSDIPVLSRTHWVLISAISACSAVGWVFTF